MLFEVNVSRESKHDRLRKESYDAPFVMDYVDGAGELCQYDKAKRIAAQTLRIRRSEGGGRSNVAQLGRLN